MLMAREQSGGRRPAILAYIRDDETCFEERLRGKPTTEKEELIAQKKLVESFITEKFRDQVGGHNKRAFHAFDRPVKFSQRLRVHLIELLDQLAGETGELLWDIGKQGPPYLGLNSFQPEHADIFFGRGGDARGSIHPEGAGEAGMRVSAPHGGQRAAANRRWRDPASSPISSRTSWTNTWSDGVR